MPPAAAASMIWHEVALRGASSGEFEGQIAELGPFLEQNWRANVSPRSGMPVYERPVALVLYREDQRSLLGSLIPRAGRTDRARLQNARLRVEQMRHYPHDRQDVARYLVSRGCKTDLLMATALGDVDLVRHHLDADPACIRMSVSEEWFPKKERALATGIFHAGTNVGAIVTPLSVPWIAGHLGWR